MTMKRSPPKPTPPRKIDQKEMEKTLSELHRLQLEVYELDSPTKIPFKGSPIKKEIKQLVGLHQNMLRPRKKNNLNLSKETIREMFQTLQQNDSSSIPIATLRKYFTPVFKSDYDFELISSGRPDVTVDELYDYLNYSQFDSFDPEREVFALLDPLNTGIVDFRQLDQMMELFGYQSVSRQMLQKVLGTDSKDITFQTFRKLMEHAEPTTPNHRQDQQQKH